MKRIIFIAVSLILMLSPILTYASNKNYSLDDNGNVVFTVVLENLQLKKEEIHEAALKYLQNAYKDTRYEISLNNKEKGILVGNGSFLAFYESSNLIKTSTYNVDFLVRIDSKDSRARLQFIAKQYSITSLSDLKDNEKQNIDICTVAPLAENKENKKDFSKAFEKFKQLVDKTLKIIKEEIESTPAQMELIEEEW